MRRTFTEGVLLARMALMTLLGSLPAVAQAPLHAVRINPTTLLNYPDLTRLQQQGDAVHLVTYARFAFGLQGHLYYARSGDGGRTWPVLEQDLGGNWVQYFDLAAFGDRALISMHDSATGPHVRTSNDRGATWTSPFLVASQPGLSYGESRVHGHGNNAMVAWLATQPGGTIWATHSADGGYTWNQSPIALDGGLPLLTNAPTNLVKVATGPDIHLFWEHGTTVAHQYSADGGITWLPQAQVVGTAPFTVTGSGNVLFLTQGSSVLRSANGGQSWAPISGTGLSAYSGIAVDGLEVVVTQVTGSAPTYQLVLNTSRDGGVSWLPAPWILATPFSLGAAPPTVQDGQFYVRIGWATLGANGATTNGVLHSRDGSSWRLMQGWADRSFWPGPARNLAITQYATNGTQPSGALFAYVHGGHTPHGQGSAGTGGLIPQLVGAGLPAPGQTCALELSAARSNALGAFYIGFGDAVDLPFGSAILHLQQPIGPFVFTASGNGTANLPITVPVSTTFAGVHWTSQAFVVDAGASMGLATSPAVESWIR